MPESFKDDNASQWKSGKSGKFDPRSEKKQKKTNRSSPKFAWVITSGTPTPTQNFITIRLSTFAPQICENAHQVTRLVFLVLPSAYSQNPCTDFHDQYVKWRRFAQGCAFWSRENKIKEFTTELYHWVAKKTSWVWLGHTECSKPHFRRFTRQMLWLRFYMLPVPGGDSPLRQTENRSLHQSCQEMRTPSCRSSASIFACW